MPTYEYECSDCGYAFEEFQSISADPLTECPECHGVVRRLLGTGAGIIFKGSGFYATDYRSPTYRQKAQSESSAQNSAGAAASTTADTSGAKASSGSDSSTKASGKTETKIN